MALDGLRWSRDSGSVHCNMPRSAVFGRSGGGVMKRLTTKISKDVPHLRVEFYFADNWIYVENLTVLQVAICLLCLKSGIRSLVTI